MVFACFYTWKTAACAAMTAKLNRLQGARMATAKAMRFLLAVLALVQSRYLSRSNASMLHTAGAAHAAANPGAVAAMIGGVPLVTSAVPTDRVSRGRRLLIRARQRAQRRLTGARPQLLHIATGEGPTQPCLLSGHL